jgi:hypothetical protein
MNIRSANVSSLKRLQGIALVLFFAAAASAAAMKTYHGKVTSIEGNKIKIALSDGSTGDWTVAANAGRFQHRAISSVHAGDQVSVVVSQDGVVDQLNVMASGKGPKTPNNKKGPTQKACQTLMNSYNAYRKNWTAAQTQCQELAAAKKPTMAVYNRYLTYCNREDTVGRKFYSMGCDKAFPKMPSPGQGPNTCAKQVHDNCPQAK